MQYTLTKPLQSLLIALGMECVAVIDLVAYICVTVVRSCCAPVDVGELQKRSVVSSITLTTHSRPSWH